MGVLHRIVIVASLVQLGSLAAMAQTPPPVLRFEVASIRPLPPEFNAGMDQNPSWVAYRAGQAKSFCMVCISGTHYDNWGTVLKSLISTAYRIDDRLVAAPDWVNQPGVRFAIHALMPAGTTREQVPELLKTLLEERFHIVVHRAVVEQTAYALVTAKGGPKLKQPGELDHSACEDWAEPNMANQEGNQMCRSSREEGDRIVNITMMTHSAWGPLLSESRRGESFETHDEYYRISMPKLAEMLTGRLSTATGGSLLQITDRTGIDGEWHVSLDGTYDRDLSLPTAAASLEKQGLRLERMTLPVEKLFVDKVDKMPTDN